MIIKLGGLEGLYLEHRVTQIPLKLTIYPLHLRPFEPDYDYEILMRAIIIRRTGSVSIRQSIHLSIYIIYGISKSLSP